MSHKSSNDCVTKLEFENMALVVMFYSILETLKE